MFTVRLDSEPDADLEDARREWDRVDDAMEAIEWALSRDPTKGDPLTESGLARSFVYVGSLSHRMPTIQVLYVLEGPYVTIKALRFSAPTYTAGNA